MRAGLGHVQRAMLTRLAAADQTTESPADLAGRSVIGDSLSRLALRGLARVTETVPAAGRCRGGKPRNIWSITPKGRDWSITPKGRDWSITPKGRDVHAGRAS